MDKIGIAIKLCGYSSVFRGYTVDTFYVSINQNILGNTIKRCTRLILCAFGDSIRNNL